MLVDGALKIKMFVPKYIDLCWNFRIALGHNINGQLSVGETTIPLTWQSLWLPIFLLALTSSKYIKNEFLMALTTKKWSSQRE